MAGGTTALYMQGFFTADTQKVSPMVFSGMKLKIVYDKMEEPMLLATAPAGKLSGLQTLMGSPEPESDSIVLGYEEAKQMTKGKNITTVDVLWGYPLEDFLGGPIRVSGMLKKTGTLLDMMHFLTEETYAQYLEGEPVEVKYNEERMPKFFYAVKYDLSNWPRNLKFGNGSLSDYVEKTEDRDVTNLDILGTKLHAYQNKTYKPLILGSKEAAMMLSEKIFSRAGDKIEGLFGQDYIVAGILEPTNTSLDMFHYTPGN